MRRWFVVLLIVLLPWRAWAGDAMVLSMAPTQERALAAATSVAATAPHCADHAATDAAGSGEPATHAVCDICNGPLLAAMPAVSARQDPLPQARLTTAAVRFASALPHPGHKPPIS